MININTNRWQSVRLLFDKRIMEVNPKSNYRSQLTVQGNETSAEGLAAVDLGPGPNGRRVKTRSRSLQ